MKERRLRLTLGALSGLAVVLAIAMGGGISSMAPVLLCALASVVILFRHLPELSNVSAENPKVKTLRFVTALNLIAVAGLAAFGTLLEYGVIQLSPWQQTLVLPVLFGSLILIFGNAAPKIPFNRYTGLRLPWTVRDEEAWIAAHRCLGYLSIPCGILCFGGVGNLKASVYIPMAALGIWILVPAALSGVVFCRKWRPKK